MKNYLTYIVLVGALISTAIFSSCSDFPEEAPYMTLDLDIQAPSDKAILNQDGLTYNQELEINVDYSTNIPQKIDSAYIIVKQYYYTNVYGSWNYFGESIETKYDILNEMNRTKGGSITFSINDVPLYHSEKDNRLYGSVSAELLVKTASQVQRANINITRYASEFTTIDPQMKSIGFFDATIHIGGEISSGLTESVYLEYDKDSTFSSSPVKKFVELNKDVTLEGLKYKTTYYYRIMTEGGTILVQPKSFTTLSNKTTLEYTKTLTRTDKYYENRYDYTYVYSYRIDVSVPDHKNISGEKVIEWWDEGASGYTKQESIKLDENGNASFGYADYQGMIHHYPQIRLIVDGELWAVVGYGL